MTASAARPASSWLARRALAHRAVTASSPPARAADAGQTTSTRQPSVAGVPPQVVAEALSVETAAAEQQNAQITASTTTTTATENLMSRLLHQARVRRSGAGYPVPFIGLKKNIEAEWHVEYGMPFTTLTKITSGRTVQVKFSCFDYITGKDDPDPDEHTPSHLKKKQGQQQQQQQKPEQRKVRSEGRGEKWLESRFAVLVSDGEKTSIVYCWTDMETYRATEIECVPLRRVSDDRVFNERLKGFDTDELPGELQGQMREFFDTEVNLDRELMLFINVFNAVREKQRYLKWLDGFLYFLSGYTSQELITQITQEEQKKMTK